jgi:hypothetical protein
VWSTVNAGDQTFNGISIGGAYDGLGAEFDGRIALVGTYDGDVETAPKWAQFAEWAWAKYGVAFTPQSVRDDYNRANGAWGVPWATTAPGGGASIDIVSNYGRFASTLSGGWAYYNTTRVHPSNHWSEVEIKQFAGHIVGPFVRYTDTNNFYVGRMDDSGADTYQIYKRVGGVYTLLGSLAETFPAAPGVRLKLEVTGSGASTSLALKLWNGSSYDTKVSVTDSAGSLTNGYTGVYGQVISGGEVHIENFWAGSIWCLDLVTVDFFGLGEAPWQAYASAPPPFFHTRVALKPMSFLPVSHSSALICTGQKVAVLLVAQVVVWEIGCSVGLLFHQEIHYKLTWAVPVVGAVHSVAVLVEAVLTVVVLVEATAAAAATLAAAGAAVPTLDEVARPWLTVKLLLLVEAVMRTVSGVVTVVMVADWRVMMGPAEPVTLRWPVRGAHHLPVALRVVVVRLVHSVKVERVKVGAPRPPVGVGVASTEVEVVVSLALVADRMVAVEQVQATPIRAPQT